MKTGVEKIIQAKGGDAPAKNQTGVQKIIELLGGDPPGPNQTGVDKIVEILENGGGGGNPNRFASVVGTLDNMTPGQNFSEDDLSYILQGLSNGNCSANISLDLTAIAGSHLELLFAIEGDVSGDIYTGRAQLCIINGSSVSDVMAGIGIILKGSHIVSGETVWFLYGSSFSALVNESIMDLDAYAEYIPTVLTIYWHPMP